MLEAQPVKLARQLGAVLVGERLHHGPPKELVGALSELGDDLGCLEGLLVDTFEAVQARDDVFQTQLNEVDLVGRLAPGALFSAI